ncbi:MAG: J domain-containing protein [Bacteroidales bacterium]|nr:J domain-containing protein [Bacteroidales bacterium]
MTYFLDVKEKSDLKSRYRKLSLAYHPDKGGELKKMQAINEEYNMLKNTFGIFPTDLRNVKVGNFVFVNNSICIVFKVESKLFYAKSFNTGRVAIFAKNTGYGLFDFKIKAYVR